MDTSTKTKNTSKCVCMSDKRKTLMTLNEAIKHALEKAGNENTPCEKQHGQLACWLKELKMFRSKYGICDIK